MAPIKPVREWVPRGRRRDRRPETLIGWIRSGELPAVDFARCGASRPRFRIKREDFDAFLARRAVRT